MLNNFFTDRLHLLGWVGLVLLAVCPFPARADALDSVVLLMEILAGLSALVLVLLLVSVWAYRRPTSRGWQVANGLGLVVSVVLGWAWHQVANQQSSGSSVYSGSLFSFNPFWQLHVPLVAWLGGVSQARYKSRSGWQRGWVALAFLGALGLAVAVLYTLTGSLLFGLFNTLGVGLGQLVMLALHLGLTFGVWQVVLGQVQQHRPLAWPSWQPAWQTAGLAAVAGLVLTWGMEALSGKLIAAHIWPQLPGTMGRGLLSWGVGTLAIWLDQRRRNQLTPGPMVPE